MRDDQGLEDAALGIMKQSRDVDWIAARRFRFPAGQGVYDERSSLLHASAVLAAAE